MGDRKAAISKSKARQPRGSAVVQAMKGYETAWDKAWADYDAAVDRAGHLVGEAYEAALSKAWENFEAVECPAWAALAKAETEAREARHG